MVVGPTSELDVAHCRSAAGGERFDVMKLQERSLGAPASAVRESAASLIAAPDLSPDRCRNVPCPPVSAGFPAWHIDCREAPTLEILERQGEGAFEHRGNVAVGNRVSQKIAGAQQLVMCLAGDCHLQLVLIPRQRNRSGSAALESPGQLGVGRHHAHLKCRLTIPASGALGPGWCVLPRLLLGPQRRRLGLFNRVCHSHDRGCDGGEFAHAGRDGGFWMNGRNQQLDVPFTLVPNPVEHKAGNSARRAL